MLFCILIQQPMKREVAGIPLITEVYVIRLFTEIRLFNKTSTLQVNDSFKKSEGVWLSSNDQTPVNNKGWRWHVNYRWIYYWPARLFYLVSCFLITIKYCNGFIKRLQLSGIWRIWNGREQEKRKIETKGQKKRRLTKSVVFFFAKTTKLFVFLINLS